MSRSDLPKELVISVANCLDTDTDITRFRAVCSSWRFSVPPPQHTPVFPLMLPFPVYNCGILRPERRGYFKLSETTVYHLQAEKNSELCTTENEWLIRVKETELGKVEIHDPFGRRIFELFPRQKVLNLLDFRLTEITKLYDLEYIDIDDIPVYSLDEDSEAEALLFRRVILSSKPVSNTHDYAIIAVNYVGILCYTKWKKMLDVDFNGVLFRLNASVVLDYKEKFYVVDKTGLVLVLSYSFEIISTIASPTHDRRPLWHCLASFGRNLFLVKENLDPGTVTTPHPVNVYKLDDLQQNWIEVSSLGDNALFFHHDSSFAVSVQDFAGLIERGCVYFLDLSFGIQEHRVPVWVFSLENGSCQKLPCTKFLK